MHSPAVDSLATNCILALLLLPTSPHLLIGLLHTTALDLGIRAEIEPVWQLAWSDIASLSKTDDDDQGCSHQCSSRLTPFLAMLAGSGLYYRKHQAAEGHSDVGYQSQLNA